MKTLYVILAPSRCGKDTLMRMIRAKNEVPTRTIKWAKYVKFVVEQAYGLPPGALELDEYRNAEAAGTGKTYLDILISFYHLQEHLPDPFFWKRKSAADFENAMKRDVDVVSTDTRDTWECDELIRLSQKHNYEIVLVRLARENYGSLSSDLHLERNYRLLKMFADASFEYTIPDCKEYVKHLDGIAKELVKNGTSRIITGSY